jgi:hypothetical protein
LTLPTGSPHGIRDHDVAVTSVPVYGVVEGLHLFIGHFRGDLTHPGVSFSRPQNVAIHLTGLRIARRSALSATFPATAPTAATLTVIPVAGIFFLAATRHRLGGVGTHVCRGVGNLVCRGVGNLVCRGVGNLVCRGVRTRVCGGFIVATLWGLSIVRRLVGRIRRVMIVFCHQCRFLLFSDNWKNAHAGSRQKRQRPAPRVCSLGSRVRAILDSPRSSRQWSE